jgi:hypothetical protein
VTLLSEGTNMRKPIPAVVVQVLVWAGILFGQQQQQRQRTDWISTSTDPDIQYRPQVFDASKVCYLEFRDQQQGSGPTTFDAAVDYTSGDLNSDKPATIKTDSEHIVTTPTHTGSSRISNCSGIVIARASFIQRH